jgi:ribosome-interacting GTPase 1
MDEPMIMREGCTVGDICDRLHKDFRRKFRYARVWGDSAKHAGQRVGLDHGLLDGDVLTLIINK